MNYYCENGHVWKGDRWWRSHLATEQLAAGADPAAEGEEVGR